MVSLFSYLTFIFRSVGSFFRNLISSEDKKHLFGEPLTSILSKQGLPLPEPIIRCMNYLSEKYIETEGIFRKSGHKVRIEELQMKMVKAYQETTLVSSKISANHSIYPSNFFDSFTAHDVADLIKIFFRNLPEPLIDVKLMNFLLKITSANDNDEQKLKACQCVILLMPDENREVFHMLLQFLKVVAQHSNKNQMDSRALAVCFSPGIFRQYGLVDNPSDGLSFSILYCHKGGDQKDFATISKSNGKKLRKALMSNNKENELIMGQNCIIYMIENVEKIFKLPESFIDESKKNHKYEPLKLEELGNQFMKEEPKPNQENNPQQSPFSIYLNMCLEDMIQESHSKAKKWVFETKNSLGASIFFKNLNDGLDFKLWKGVITINSSVENVFERIMHNRPTWDDSIVEEKIIQVIDNQTDIVYLSFQSLSSILNRHYKIIRRWNKLEDGSYVVVCTSIDVDYTPSHQSFINVPYGTMMASRYRIEPHISNNNKSTNSCKVTIIQRIDAKGRRSLYYKYWTPHFILMELSKLKLSFQQDIGNETII